MVDGAKTNVDVEWPAVPMKSFGIRFKPGAVAAVLAESPAALAGVREGDSLVSLNEKPIEDCRDADVGGISMHGKKASLTLEHEDKTRFQLEWQVPTNSC